MQDGNDQAQGGATPQQSTTHETPTTSGGGGAPQQPPPDGKASAPANAPAGGADGAAAGAGAEGEPQAQAPTDAYRRGVEAAREGKDRSPPYESEPERRHWLLGYDDHGLGTVQDHRTESVTTSRDEGEGQADPGRQVSHADVRDGIQQIMRAVERDSRYDACRNYLAEALQVCPPVSSEPITFG